MIGVIMAGGRGTRMNSDTEKLLLEYTKPVILHVVDALVKSRSFTRVLAATSHNSPDTKKLLEQNNVEIFETPGLGYVRDLKLVLKNFTGMVLVTSGDLPYLDEKIIADIVGKFNPAHIWTSVLVTKKFLAALGMRSDYTVNFDGKTCHYTGISIINSDKVSFLQEVAVNYVIIDDERVAFNLNTKQDYDLFRRYLRSCR